LAAYLARMDRTGMCAGLWWECLLENTYLEDREGDVRILLRWKEMCWKVDIADS
jgi:hypothetical protein